MDVGSENRGDEPQQAPEKETAIGSAGLFGDLRHEKPKQSQQSSVDPQPVQGPYAPTQQAAFDQTAANTSRLNRPLTHDATEMQESSQRQRFEHSLANQPTVPGAQSSVQPQSHHAGPTISQKTFAAGAAGQQQPLQSPNTVSEQQATTHALYDEQAEQQQPQQQEDITTDLDQAPPMMEAQLAEEQDLVPDELDETDSAIGSDTQSTTTTLSQSVFDFRTEHGRTYHAYKDGKYIFPNDEREADRLDLQHHLFRITFANQLFFAPLDQPRRCLDVGTGTGIWAIEFADQFSDCQVIGIDLSPGQPTLVPPNLKFVIDDAEDMWIYPEKFDFIHARLMAGCFADWPNFFRQAYENLEPGGWLELQDYGLPVKSADGTADNTNLLRWGELLCEAARKLGRPLGSDCADFYQKWMEEAGFVDLQVRMFMWPSNGWPKDPFMKELGRWNQMNILDGLEGFCLALLIRGLGWQKEEVDVFVAKVSRDFRDRKIHAYFPMPVVFGRKPFPGEEAFRG